VVAPYPLELPSPVTPPTPARATSLDHESTTMEISSAVREPHLDETEAPDAGIITPEKEKQGDSLNEGSPPPTSTSVQFIGINYVPDSTDVQRAPRPPPLHPTPWESGATSRSSEDHVVIRLSTFPPKPQQQQQVKRRVVPVSRYQFGSLPEDSAYFSPPVGQIGVHHPREIVRVERDYTGGEVMQFSSAYPLELEGRITPRQFMESINAINEVLISAYSLWHSVLDNCVEIFSLQVSRLLLSTHYEREMKRLERLVEDLNLQLFNPAGLNVLWPRKVGFMFLEIEYY